MSARRDRLITKEFETEVPVRCTLFVDTSASVRVPSPSGRPLQRLVEIAAGVAQASAAARDLTGVFLFDEEGVSGGLRPDRTNAHLTRMLQLLADAAGLQPATARIEPQGLLDLTYAFANLVYPDRLRPATNAMPTLLNWFGTYPSYWRNQNRGLTGGVGLITWLYRMKGWLALLLMRDLPIVVFLSSIVLDQARFPDVFVNIMFLTSFILPLLGIATFLGITLITRRPRRIALWRKRLAALLSVEYGYLPGGLAAFLEDDDALALAMQRFLADHRVPYSLPFYDTRGRYRFAASAKVEVLATALTTSVARGHDNELFVLLADLLELDDRLDPLVRAVRVALARHHQVMLICPWPPGLATPGNAELPRSRPAENLEGSLHERLERRTRRRFHNAYHRVRRIFTRLGATCYLCRQRRTGAAHPPAPGTSAFCSEEPLMSKADRTAGVDPNSVAANTLTMMCLAALLGIVVALVARNLGGLVLAPLLIGLTIILARLWIGPPLLLVVVLIVMMWHHPTTNDYALASRGLPTGSQSTDALQDINWLFDPLLACALLIFTACHYRLLGLTRYLLPLDLRTPGRLREGTLSTRPHVRVPESVGPTELSGVVLAGLLFTALALAVAIMLGQQDNPFSPHVRTNIWQALVIVWVGSLLLMSSWALIGYLRLRQASPQESLQYLQDQHWLASYRDQGRLARWLTWARLRFQRNRKPSATTDHTNPKR